MSTLVGHETWRAEWRTGVPSLYSAVYWWPMLTVPAAAVDKPTDDRRLVERVYAPAEEKPESGWPAEPERTPNSEPWPMSTLPYRMTDDWAGCNMTTRAAVHWANRHKAERDAARASRCRSKRWAMRRCRGGDEPIDDAR